MTRMKTVAAIAAAGCWLALGSVPGAGQEPVEVGQESLLIQGFEAPDVLEKKPNVSYLSGVPEEAEVEVWDGALYRRRKVPHEDSGIACRIAAGRKTQGQAALEATFARDDRWLRVSLRNNINQEEAGRPPCNSLGCFDRLRGDVFNASDAPVSVEMRVLGGFAVTDKAATFSLERTLNLRPGWNEFAVTSQEASATFVDPHDATCVEFRVPGAKGAVLCFDNFRVERETIGKNLSAHARCFDFGVAHFNWPGFTYGSVAWDDQRGYGFTSGKNLTHGGDLHVINDDLTRDGFAAPASFRVKVPNGRYKVVTQTGNYWAQRDGGLNIEIKAEGKRVYYRPKMTDQEFIAFKHAHERADHWKRGLDLWATYEEGTYFRTIAFDVEVADGALDLDFLLPPVEDGRPHGSSIWTYLIVYPADKEDVVAPELKRLNEKVSTVYNKVSHVPISRQFALYNREEVICAEEFLWPDLAGARRRALKPGADESARGYIHFLRHCHDLLTPDSVPLPQEISDRIALFAAPGETVQCSVGLYPLKDLRKVNLSLGDLKDESGKAVIPSSSVEVRLVSYRPMTPVTSNHAECFHYIGPGVLLMPEPIDVPKEYPRNWWVSVLVPKDAPAGILRGEARIQVAGQTTSTVRIALRVLPFTLDEPKGVTFAVDYSGTMSFRPEDGPAELAFFRALGMNTVWYRGEARFADVMRRPAQAAGMELEIGDPRKYQNWRWPADYREVLVRRLLARGERVSFQPTHTGHREGRRIRFSHGFWLWRSGIRHRVVQTQPNAAERVYYAHYGHAKFGPCSYLFPSLAGAGRFNPAPTLYEVRDGIYDWRYIQTLETLLAPADEAAGQSRASAAAGKYLAELKDAVKGDLDYYYFERKRHFNHVDRFGLHDTVWPGWRYQMERWELARHVAAVKGKPLGGSEGPAGPAPGGNVILHSEYFGPFWVDESQFALFSEKDEGQPRLQVEIPKTLVGEDRCAVLVKLDHPSDISWMAILKDSAGKTLATENVGVLKRWKTRWVLRTSHLPAGVYTLEVLPVPAGRDVPLGPESTCRIAVLPGIE